MKKAASISKSDLGKTEGEKLFELELELRGAAASLATDDTEENRAALRQAARLFADFEREIGGRS